MPSSQADIVKAIQAAKAAGYSDDDIMGSPDIAQPVKDYITKTRQVTMPPDQSPLGSTLHGAGVWGSSALAGVAGIPHDLGFSTPEGRYIQQHLGVQPTGPVEQTLAESGYRAGVMSPSLVTPWGPELVAGAALSPFAPAIRQHYAPHLLEGVPGAQTALDTGLSAVTSGLGVGGLEAAVARTAGTAAPSIAPTAARTALTTLGPAVGEGAELAARVLGIPPGWSQAIGLGVGTATTAIGARFGGAVPFSSVGAVGGAGSEYANPLMPVAPPQQ